MAAGIPSVCQKITYTGSKRRGPQGPGKKGWNGQERKGKGGRSKTNYKHHIHHLHHHNYLRKRRLLTSTTTIPLCNTILIVLVLLQQSLHTTHYYPRYRDPPILTHFAAPCVYLDSDVSADLRITSAGPATTRADRSFTKPLGGFDQRDQGSNAVEGLSHMRLFTGELPMEVISCEGFPQGAIQ